MSEFWTQDPVDALRVDAQFDLDTFDRASTPGFSGGKADAVRLMQQRGELLSELQERLFAQGRAGGKRNILVVVQGLDTAGKGGIARHVMGMVDPQGVAMRSFGVPTPEELRHHYLWRIKRALPKPGLIGLFDRSHYEDVLVARVNELVPQEVWEPRFAEINRWEKSLAEAGTVVLKFALMVSHDEQAKRLMERIDRPDKRWKYSMSDIETRLKWDDYQEAYADVFSRTSTEHAPWHVLPADRKWYPRLAVTELVTRALIDMDLRWPRPRWRPEVQRRRLAATMTIEALASSVAETEAVVQSAIDASIDVKIEATQLAARESGEEVRAATLTVIKDRRAELEADLARTLEQKRELLEQFAPALASQSKVDATAEPAAVGTPKGQRVKGQQQRAKKPGKKKGKKRDKKGGK